MNKGTRLTKRMVALFLVLLLGIESFGAVVSDNDGSAFITKAEFDSLKNSFQAQIDQYNTSIDSKIDGAIASYLAGIQTKTRYELPILLSNYNNIVWQPNWKLYGRYKKWSNRTTVASQLLTNGWYTPSAAEKRANIRNLGMYVYDYWGNTYGCMMLSMIGNVTAFDGTTLSYEWGLTGQPGPPPIFCINEYFNEQYGLYVLYSDPYRHVGGYDCHLHTFGHSPEVLSDSHDTRNFAPKTKFTWYNATNGWTPVAASSLAADSYMEYEVKFYTDDVSTGTTNEVQHWKSVLNQSTATWPPLNNIAVPNSVSFFEKVINDGWSGDPYNKGNAKYFATGATHHYIYGDKYGKQVEAFLNMMFGTGNNQEANVIKPLTGNKSGAQAYDFSDSSDYGTVSVNWTAAGMAAPGSRYNPSMHSQITFSKTGVLKLPYFPIHKLKNMTSARFIYNDKPLTMGQGCPLIRGENTDGDLQIEFDYNIYEMLYDTDYTSSKDLYIDVKKDDFVVSDTDYKSGYVGIVESESATTPINLLKNFKYPERNGKVKLTIPIKKDESIWIRINPGDESGGYCAKMSNLKMTMNTYNNS